MQDTFPNKQYLIRNNQPNMIAKDEILKITEHMVGEISTQNYVWKEKVPQKRKYLLIR